jgi:hypothetical protein
MQNYLPGITLPADFLWSRNLSGRAPFISLLYLFEFFAVLHLTQIPGIIMLLIAIAEIDLIIWLMKIRSSLPENILVTYLTRVAKSS